MQRTREASSPSVPRQLDPLLLTKPRPSTAQPEPLSSSTSTLSTRSRNASVGLLKRRSVLQDRHSASARYSIASANGRRSVSPPRRKTTLGARRKSRGPDRDEDDEEFSDEESDEHDGVDDGRDFEAMKRYDVRHAEIMYQETQAGANYEDGGKVYHGSIDRRGITPYVTFTATEPPPSVVKSLQLKATQKPTCGFCGGDNLVWMLRCCFCACARMSDTPRLKYLLDMIMSAEPQLKAEELAKRILNFAKFDHVAIKVEQKFKQASLVRARAAIMMMSRTINILRHQMMRMIFTAWKGNNAIQTRHDAIMHRLIKIKDIQLKSHSKELVFSMWKGYVTRVIDERTQRLSLASRRNDLTRARRVWGCWLKFLRIRAKEKLQQLKAQYEAERQETPNTLMTEMEQLKDNLKEARRLVFTTTNAMLELLQQSLRSADNDVLRFLQLKQMYPNTIGRFTETVNGQKILDALSSGSIAAADGDTSTDDVSADEMMAKCAANTKAQIDQMAPHDNLIQWLNFQGQRGTDMAYEAAQITPVGAAQANAIRLKPKVKEKKKEYREIKGLQDLRARISSPGAMLKLLCHASEDARAEYDRFRATETSSNTSTAAAENSTMTTTLSPSALLQLKAYFKIVGRNLNLPPDVITRDAFVLGDFNSLYAYAVYLYTFHPNYIAPGLALSPRYHLSYEFLTPQWEKIQRVLTENMCDPFAQQQLYIFIAKIKRVNKQFLRFEQVCHYVDEIAQWHQQSALRETFNDFTRRVLGKDSNISVALERETLASWVSLSPAKLLNLCANEDELKDIEKVFKDNVLDLVKIFRIYGSGAGGKGILEQEFLKVMTRAGVTDKKNILRSHLQIIYQQARQSSPTPTPTSSPASNSSTSPAGGSGSDGEDDAGADDRGATPNEFFEALVRVAHHNFQKRRDPGGFVNPLVAGTLGVGIGATLLLHVIELVVDKIVPLTKKFQEQGLMFKKQMVHPDVQYVCKTQEKKLKRVFVAYSQKNKNPNSRGKLMDLNDFETLLKDRRLVDALFPYGKVKQLVSFVQQDGDLSAMGGGGFDSDTEFVFTEFLEALAAIAVYRNANPYLPLAKKLEMFFDEYF